MDQDVINLAKSIRQVESGGNFSAKGASGENGGYQFMPTTWKGWAKEVLGNENADMSPDNQNAVAYVKIKQWKDSGLNPAQIAAKWNSGSEQGWENKIGVNSKGVKYDVPAYVKKVTDTYQSFKQSNIQQFQQPQGITGNESALDAGLNALQNTPMSALRFAGGVAQSLNPVNTVQNIGKIGSGFSELAQQQGAGKTVWDIVKGLPQAAYETLVPQGVRQTIAGDFQGASKTFQEDPFGQAAPLVLAAEGGVRLADKYAGGNAAAQSVQGAQLVNNASRMLGQGSVEGINPVNLNTPGVYSQAFSGGISTAASPLIGAVEGAGKVAKGVAKSFISQVTGLNPETLNTVFKNPEQFSKAQQEAASRPSLAEEFRQGLDQLIESKAETGKEYSVVRSDVNPVTIGTDFIGNILKKNKLKIEDGTIVADTNSVTRNAADLKAIQTFYDNWGGKQTLTANEFLNMRSDLADLAQYDKLTGIGKTKIAQVIADQLRQEANKVIRPKIKGLEELDSRMAPQIEAFKQARKDFLNADGTFKDGAANKIANAKGLGKEKLLERMEEISPGITKSIEILKAVEDIQRANGIKVGTYTRGVLQGMSAFSGNIPLIISAILTHPAIAVQLLRGFGITGKAVLPIIQVIESLMGGVNNSQIPTVASVDSTKNTKSIPPEKSSITTRNSQSQVRSQPNLAQTK